MGNPRDLMKYSRVVVHLDLNSLPMAAPSMFAVEQLEDTNSYLVDFMTHGKMRYLMDDNGLNSTKAWKLINATKESVQMASKALKFFSPDEDIVVTTFERLGEEMERYLKGS